MSFFKHLAHYLLPHESNNQKAKLLHSSSLFVIALILLLYQLGLYSLPKSGVKVLGYASNISISDIVRFTNEKRAQDGLPSLQVNDELTKAAKAKGEDMLAKDYWAHVAPDGTEPWKFFKEVGYTYRYAGENLARDFSDASSTVDAWMASPTHKANLLSNKYQDIGVAVVEGDLNGADTTIVVQLFGTKQVAEAPLVPVAHAETQVAPLAENKVIPAQTQVSLEPTKTEIVKPKLVVSPFNTTRNVSLFIVGILLLVLVVDGIITTKRGISRISGRTFAHLSFLGMILAVALILKAGEIL